MDALDFALLAALSRDPRRTYGELGESVGLTANAAKARVHRLRDDGVLQGFAALPRPSLLGLHEGLLLFTGLDDLDEREDEVLRGLAEVPGVRAADAAVDHALWVWLLYRDDADWERIERAAISLAGKPPARRVRSEPAAPGRALQPGDWRVVRALQHDGRAQAKDLARLSGLTFKPLKRRLDALLRAGDVRIRPVVSAAEARGAVLFRVILFLEPDAPAPALPHDAILEQDAPGVLSLLLQRPSLRDARALARALRALPGVERAHLQIATRRASLAWLDDAVARLTAPAPAVAPVPMARTR